MLAVVSVTLTVGAKDIHKFDESGAAKATMRIPFALPAGCNPINISVFYISDDGTQTEKMNVRYENGFLVWDTTHFSDFVITYDETASVFTISGTVKSANTAGDITVRLLDGNGNEVASDIADADGKYSLTVQNPGRYTLIIEKPKHVPRKYTVDLKRP